MSKALHRETISMIRAGKSESEIRAAIEPRLPPGCSLTMTSESCITDTGTSGYRKCGQITGCDDPDNNTDPECGGCLGS
jgi:hypothetical protein